MIYKCLFCVLLASFAPVECYDDYGEYEDNDAIIFPVLTGNSCSGVENLGTCKPLARCPYLLSEIKRAGTPMPAYLRRKLQQLACGYDYDEPLICCESIYTNIDHTYTTLGQNPPTQDFRPTHNWLGSNEEHEINSRYPPQDNYNTNPQDNYNTNKNKNPPSYGDDISNHRNFNLLPKNCGPIEDDRVYGGERTSLFEMPWMVLLAYDSARGTKLSCGGSLITEWYVLTAAHCVSFLGTKLRLQEVVIGEYDTRSDPDCERNEGELVCAPNVQNVAIDRIIAHSGYTPQSLVDDIALIRLARPADFSLDSLKPICLPVTSELRNERLDGQKGVVAGWGATEDGLQSPVLLSVNLPITTNYECSVIYNGSTEIHSTQLCAGGVAGKDSCGGDSGGPLLYPGLVPGRRGGSGTSRYVQRGIVSYGSKRCGIGGFPGVYTRVADYMEWILDNIS
ncbi:CLIP domain-containing serine protease 2-like isoform X2 [Aricia agestis]|uniref:CLIP domain-containing serine protease 2-like isoform X2 n=1 Tax=Aricia agestis TaxID=91739 RepID=UPI001C201B8C|nr:CLIP domain-containing serine protease 2-like isoform X2 [Aricia agestis]